jgi:hypothetical protein
MAVHGRSPRHFSVTGSSSEREFQSKSTVLYLHASLRGFSTVTLSKGTPMPLAAFDERPLVGSDSPSLFLIDRNDKRVQLGSRAGLGGDNVVLRLAGKLVISE